MLTPMPGKVVVEPIDPLSEKEKSSGILLAQTREKERPTLGRIIASNKEDNLPKGGQIIFEKYGASEVEDDGKEYLIVNLEDIVAVVKS